MNIKSMLARLESALGRNDLIEQMVLLPSPATPDFDLATSTKTIDLVVGYNSSPRSQTALDLTLWIAHQTRLATSKQVTVQVVYVLDENQASECPDVFSLADASRSSNHHIPLEFADASESRRATPVLIQPSDRWLSASPGMASVDRRNYKAMLSPTNSFERADRILWQARCLAEEWRGSFTAHLRFGCAATELRKVVESEAATLLFLGCHSANHPIIQKLGANLPCAVLGIPANLKVEDYSKPSSDFRSL